MLHHAFLVHDLLETTKRSLYGLALLQFDLNHCLKSPSLRDPGADVNVAPVGSYKRVKLREVHYNVKAVLVLKNLHH